MKRSVVALLLSLLVLHVGCGASTSTNVLVRDAILHYLSGRTDLDLSKMDVQIDSLQQQGDRATAEVTIMARQDAKAQMQMVYELQRTGEGGWEVVPPEGADAAHAGGAPPPSQSPPPGERGSEQNQELPPGHPSIGEPPAEPTPELPAGHPPVSPE